ncbi:MAG TPA: hypothetical protein VGO61_21830 [Steroidobacteraceae bacterium]|nr:hypothetical protein [Steroidobacteraceae bacterium]
MLTLARAHSAALICAPVLAVTVAPPAPPVVDLPNPIGVPPLPPPLLLLPPPVLTVMVWARVDCVPQVLVYVAVAVQDAVGWTVCVREVPDVPQPLHDQLPPDDGRGAKATCAPEATVALAVCVPLITAVIVVAGQEPPELELDEPEPVGPYEQ